MVHLDHATSRWSDIVINANKTNAQIADRAMVSTSRFWRITFRAPPDQHARFCVPPGVEIWVDHSSAGGAGSSITDE